MGEGWNLILQGMQPRLQIMKLLLFWLLHDSDPWVESTKCLIMRANLASTFVFFVTPIMGGDETPPEYNKGRFFLNLAERRTCWGAKNTF